ncbi:hypothetical protein ACP4OV_020730 [Aristida adscensionis]
MSRPLLCASLLLLLLLLLASTQSQPAVSAGHPSPRRRRYDSIFSFGDSFADSGNKPVVFAWYSVFNPVMRPPYGSTFFGHPTGRTTDGRLILDFIAQDLGLPFVPPSLAHNGSFRQGANFAVAGATAVDAEFYHSRGIPGGPGKFPLNTSLDVQLEWFQSLEPSLCGTAQGCKEFFGRSLFFVGEFGVNDYHLSLKKLTVQQVRSLIVPNVIKTISMAIERLIIKHGATNLVVPGVIPSGCSPPVLTFFAGHAGPTDYDPRTGCLREINELGKHHNSLLQDALHELRAKHGHVRIVYADFFSPIMEMVKSPRKFGFRDVLMVCCGGPGKYNYNNSVACGDPDATPCEDPAASLYWDGVHLTEAGYRHVADGWLSSIDSSARAGGAKGCKDSASTLHGPAQ